MWWLFGGCWGSRATIIIHYGFDCSGTFYCNWDILQCIGCYHGRSTDMATSLSHTCKKDVNKGVVGLLSHLFVLLVHCYELSILVAIQLSSRAKFLTDICN